MRAYAPVVVLASTLLLSGCGVQGLSFRQDTRLEFRAPEHRARDLEVPITVEWTISDFEITGPAGGAEDDAGYFALFLNRRPQPPGHSLEWLARDDETCIAAHGCPDEEYFADRGVHTTTETEFTFERLPDIDEPYHEVTIILLDGRGERIGESDWAIEFRTEDHRG